MIERTPTPWKFADSIGHEFKAIYPDTGKPEFALAAKPEYIREDIWEANAAFIVNAVNCRDELVEALELYLKARPQCPCESNDCEMAVARKKSIAALAKAKGAA